MHFHLDQNHLLDIPSNQKFYIIRDAPALFLSRNDCHWYSKQLYHGQEEDNNNFINNDNNSTTTSSTASTAPATDAFQEFGELKDALIFLIQSSDRIFGGSMGYNIFPLGNQYALHIPSNRKFYVTRDAPALFVSQNDCHWYLKQLHHHEQEENNNNENGNFINNDNSTTTTSTGTAFQEFETLKDALIFLVQSSTRIVDSCKSSSSSNNNNNNTKETEKKYRSTSTTTTTSTTTAAAATGSHEQQVITMDDKQEMIQNQNNKRPLPSFQGEETIHKKPRTMTMMTTDSPDVVPVAAATGTATQMGSNTNSGSVEMYQPNDPPATGATTPQRATKITTTTPNSAKTTTMMTVAPPASTFASLVSSSKNHFFQTFCPGRPIWKAAVTCMGFSG